MCVEILLCGRIRVFVLAIWRVVSAFGGVQSLGMLYALHQLIPNIRYVSPFTAYTVKRNLFVFMGQENNCLRVKL
jgi:hypothetical protein